MCYGFWIIFKWIDEYLAMNLPQRSFINTRTIIFEMRTLHTFHSLVLFIPFIEKNKIVFFSLKLNYYRSFSNPISKKFVRCIVTCYEHEVQLNHIGIKSLMFHRLFFLFLLLRSWPSTEWWMSFRWVWTRSITSNQTMYYIVCTNILI